ncbi:MAG TPA: GNAT family N-acetyltransferase [Rugosimonospora sp.]|nr:GNAT family N-acetyltransferase [Rugosimonospora sp.]
MDLRWCGAGDGGAVSGAAALFDFPTRTEWVQRFLAQPGHHLCLAYLDGAPAGFVSGVELTHPDKGTEMFLYELAVDEAFRRRGVGRALVRALAGRARERGCYSMWVLTDEDNVAALRTYRSAGAEGQSRHVMLDWHLDSP